MTLISRSVYDLYHPLCVARDLHNQPFLFVGSSCVRWTGPKTKHTSVVIQQWGVRSTKNERTNERGNEKMRTRPWWSKSRLALSPAVGHVRLWRSSNIYLAIAPKSLIDSSYTDVVFYCISRLAGTALQLGGDIMFFNLRSQRDPLLSVCMKIFCALVRLWTLKTIYEAHMPVSPGQCVIRAHHIILYTRTSYPSYYPLGNVLYCDVRLDDTELTPVDRLSE